MVLALLTLLTDSLKEFECLPQEFIIINLNAHGLMLFRIGHLGVTYGWGGAVVKKVSLPDTCHTYPTT